MVVAKKSKREQKIRVSIADSAITNRADLSDKKLPRQALSDERR